MDDYLNTFREMVSLRGLTDHTVKSYSTYIRAYLDYLNNVLHKLPEDVSWDELRGFIRWLQNQKNLSDRTINACISQLRFFTIMSSINHGMQHGYPCVNLMLFFLTFHQKKKLPLLFQPFRT